MILKQSFGELSGRFEGKCHLLNCVPGALATVARTFASP
jgi:hypothetical protein